LELTLRYLWKSFYNVCSSSWVDQISDNPIHIPSRRWEKRLEMYNHMGIRDISNSCGALFITPNTIMETETESTTVTAIVVDRSCTGAGDRYRINYRDTITGAPNKLASSRIISLTAGHDGKCVSRPAPPVAGASALAITCAECSTSCNLA
jgi:hypothetical protein